MQQKTKENRLARKQRTGTVLKDTNEKSVVVGVSWLQPDRIYKKARRKLTKFVVHDEQNSATVGDRVLIEESRPLSRSKRWRLVEILEKIVQKGTKTLNLRIDVSRRLFRVMNSY